MVHGSGHFRNCVEPGMLLDVIMQEATKRKFDVDEAA